MRRLYGYSGGGGSSVFVLSLQLRIVVRMPRRLNAVACSS
jgi:hypothetical protein